MKRILCALPLFALLLGGCGHKEQAPAFEPHVHEAPPPEAAAAPADNSTADEEAPTDLSPDTVDEPLPPLDEDGNPAKVVLQGQLHGLSPDSGISADVTMYQDSQGARLLRLENMQSPSDKALELVFTRTATPKADTPLPDKLVLGPLKGHQGNMNYFISSDSDIRTQRALVLVASGDSIPLAYCLLGKAP